MNTSDQDFFKRKTIPPEQGIAREFQDAPIPSKIGPYSIEAVLEKGGMSVLYLGKEAHLEKPIIIKVLSPRFLAHPEMTSRFLKEAEIIALADHPNIVKLSGYGQWEQGLYIAMEYIQGLSLRNYLQEHPLSLKKAIEMVLEIAYALCHLHTHGVIHRDLKPENILVDETGHIKVIDFGIAQLIDPLQLTKADYPQTKSRLIGTPIYMSPEQRTFPETVSYPSDIYSLGIIAYELVVGKIQGGQVAISLAPRGLQKILAKALQQRPADRYIDIVDFISDLSAYLNSIEFGKDKKPSDQAAELFEKIQLMQKDLIQGIPISFRGLEVGLEIHRPLGFGGLFLEVNDHTQEIKFGMTKTQDSDRFLHLLYLKGLLADKNFDAALLHDTHASLSWAFLKWDHATNTLFRKGAKLWQLPENILCDVEEIHLKKEMKLILCPGFENEELLKELLEEGANLPPQALAEFLYRKAKALRLRYFEEHPFIALVFSQK